MQNKKKKKKPNNIYFKNVPKSRYIIFNISKSRGSAETVSLKNRKV